MRGLGYDVNAHACLPSHARKGSSHTGLIADSLAVDGYD